MPEQQQTQGGTSMNGLELGGSGSSPADGGGSGGGEYVTFSLNAELYAFDALKVQEIIELTTVTKVPHLPGHLKGVINLRGTIIPVVDLKQKFAMEGAGAYRKHTCIIVTEFSAGVMGLIVDTVSDIMYLPASSISPPPDFGARIRSDFIAGMARSGEGLILLLDVDKVLTAEEQTVAEQLAEQPAPAALEGTAADAGSP